MGDRLMHRQRFLTLPMSRAQTARILGVKLADELFPQIDLPELLAGWFEAEALADKGPADEPQTSPPVDLSPVTYPACRPSFRIDQWWQHSGIGPVAGPINCCWRALAQGFMRAILVVTPQPARRTCLQAPPVRTRRRHDLPLITTMELLVRRVVTRPRPPGELDADAQAQPPD